MDTENRNGPKKIEYKEGDIRWTSIFEGACYAKETMGADGVEVAHTEYVTNSTLPNPEASRTAALLLLKLG